MNISKSFKQFTLITILIFLLSYQVSAEYENYPLGARSAGLSNASVMYSDIWSIHHNQAGLAYLDGITVGVYNESYFHEQYGLKALAIAVPTNMGALGTVFSHFGYQNYYEQKIGLSYAKALNNKVAIGVQLDYLRLFIRDYGSDDRITFETGIYAELLPNWYIGIHAYNPARISLFSDRNTQINTIFRAGTGYNYKNKFYIAFETEKEIDRDPVYKIGAAYTVYNNIDIRIGYKIASQIEPTFHQNTYSFGLGFRFIGIHSNIAFTHHNQLGYIAHISLNFTL